MKSAHLLEKILRENALPVLARAQTARLAGLDKREGPVTFAGLRHALRRPETNWREAVAQIWEALQRFFASDYAELEQMLAAAGARMPEEIRLWLWRRVARSGNLDLMSSRFFAEEFLFYRTLQEEHLFAWYGDRVVAWPIQLLLALFLGSQQETQRLRRQLYWPTAKLPADFRASRQENRALRRLWEARVLVRYGNWVHLHPLIMLQLPEISAFASPVFSWREQELLAHMPDGRAWPIAPFNLAALICDETLALCGHDRRGWWRTFAAFAEVYTRRPEDVASHFVAQCFAELGLPNMAEAPPRVWKALCEGIKFFETLRTTHA